MFSICLIFSLLGTGASLDLKSPCDSGATGRSPRVVCFYDAACRGNRKPRGDTQRFVRLRERGFEASIHDCSRLKLVSVFTQPGLRHAYTTLSSLSNPKHPHSYIMKTSRIRLFILYHIP